MRRIAAAASLAFALMPGPVRAQEPPDLANLDLEDLMKVKVVSVSKKEQSLAGLASAVYVLTAEDIRRSGATSLPDALRLVPGMNVARISGERWSISSRGFSQLYANKLLVLVDGVSVYNTSFGGVDWGTFEPPIDDVERIEVIRGPGAAVWGADAMNGVVNIITREARSTQEGFASVDFGSDVRGNSLARYGGAVGSGYYRVDVGSLFDGASSSQSAVGNSSWWGSRHMGSVGFRMDLRPAERDTVQVETMSVLGERHDTGSVPSFGVVPPVMTTYDQFDPSRSLLALARWTRTMSSRAQTSAEVFGTGFLNSGSQTQMSGRVVGVELQNHVGFGRHDLSLIGMARWTMSDITPSGTVITAPSRRTDRELNASFQDDIALPGELTLTVGAKFEDSTMATFQVEPTVRIAWRANESHSLWAAVSRAARTPSHYELDSTLKPLVQQLPEGVGVLTIFGNPALDAEHMIAYEAGYRAQWHRGLSVDTALFFNRYNGLIESVPGVPFVDAFSPFVRIALPSTWMNVADETTYGLEARARYQVRPAWVVDTSYSWLHEESPDSTVAYNDPNHQWQIGSNVTLARVWEAGARLYVMGRVPANGIQAEIEPYARLDAQVSRALSSRVSLSVVGQNLTHDSHTEASLFGLLQAQSIQRSAHVRLTWRF